jgi:hypothetical protein
VSDRALLEAAARAAGLKIHRRHQAERDADGFGGVGLWIVDVSTAWNPLTDDSDALRLAVKLGLTINPYQEGVFVSRFEGEEVVAEPFEFIGRPDTPATRRAIVRAAAKMGEKHVET